MRSIKIKKKNIGKIHTILQKSTPFSYAEAYKNLRTNFEFAASATKAKTILLTSAVPDESKSTTAINLAITLAENHHSVILVECDLRKPGFKRYLKLDRLTKGLTSLLSGNADLKECITNVKSMGISIIHAGMVPPNPAELLNQDSFARLIKELEQEYDYVILDTPPITIVTDAAVVGRVADGALLVIKSKHAQTKTVRLAKKRLEAVGIEILGAVLTEFNVKKSGWKSGYGYLDYEYGSNKI